jgi:septum formation protein
MGTTLNMALPRIVLASASPARLRILQAVGIRPDVQVSNVDETAAEIANGWITPIEIAGGLAKIKAAAIADLQSTACVVIGCDSVMEYDGNAYGKPDSAEIAIERLRMMSGGSGVLHTGHSVGIVNADRATWVHAVCSTEVFFHELSEAEISAYVATGEPLKVAGSFTIDSFGAPFIRAIKGDAANVEGLSVQTLRKLFQELGIGWEQVLAQVTAE